MTVKVQAVATEYAKARPRDVALLQTLFVDEGRELKKTDASKRYRIPERRFRAAVAHLRSIGIPIVSFSEHGSTYHLAHDDEELEHFVNELRSRRDELDFQIRVLDTQDAKKRIPRTNGIQRELAI